MTCNLGHILNFSGIKQSWEDCVRQCMMWWGTIYTCYLLASLNFVPLWWGYVGLALSIFVVLVCVPWASKSGLGDFGGLAPLVAICTAYSFQAPFTDTYMLWVPCVSVADSLFSSLGLCESQEVRALHLWKHSWGSGQTGDFLRCLASRANQLGFKQNYYVCHLLPLLCPRWIWDTNLGLWNADTDG